MRKTNNLEEHLINEDDAEIEKELKNNPLYKHTTRKNFWMYKDFPNTRTNIFNEFVNKIRMYETDVFRQVAIDFYLSSGL